MSDDDDVLASLQFHDDRLKPNDHVAVTLSTSVAVIVFIVITSLEVFRVLIGNFLVGQAIADAGIKFVESFPFKFVIALWRSRQEPRGLDGTFKRRGPDGQLTVIANRLSYKIRKRTCIELASGRDVCVTADFAMQVKVRFPMLDTDQYAKGKPNAWIGEIL